MLLMWRLCTLSVLLLTEWWYIQYQTYLQFGPILSFEAVITVKSGQISRLRSRNLKYTTNTIFHWKRNILPHLLYSMIVNNILFLKSQHLYYLLWFFTPTSTAKRRRSTPLGIVFLMVFVVPDHRHDAYIQRRQSNSACTINMSYRKEKQPPKFGH